MANVSFAFFLMMGAVGFYSAFTFVRYIYRCGARCDAKVAGATVVYRCLLVSFVRSSIKTD